MKVLSLNLKSSWLDNFIIASLKSISDVLLIKSILAYSEAVHENVSLIGDNRVLISFKSLEGRDNFLGQKLVLVDYFSDLKP